MDQPPLPDIGPYVNRFLFSEHFLNDLLPQDQSWQADEDKLKLTMQALTNLYAGREEEWSKSLEPQLEDRLIRPVLQALGHKFEVQPSLPAADAVSRPDYVFFETDEERRRAKKEHQGELEYFHKAIAVGDAKRWDRSLDKKERAGRDSFDMLSPSWQIDYYLRMSGVKWGILTNGRLWRLYNRDISFRLDIYYEIDLPGLLAAKALETFKCFFLFFRSQAFVPDAEGLCFLDGVYQGSLQYARAVGGDLKDNVYKALRLLAEGFLHTRGNNLDPVHDLDKIYANSLVLLYRLLFINYAEDRRLLPRDNALYKESYGLVSMHGEIASKLQRRESLPTLQVTYWEKVRTLFNLVNQGTEALGIGAETMDVPPYNGGLFDPSKHPFLERYRVEDRWLAQVIDLLARSQGEGVGTGDVDYSSLDVRHLGSIYEGLLEYKLRLADEDMVAVKRGGKEQWIPSSEAGSSRVLERVEPGSVYLATDRGERKATGSYYTPDYVVKYIVEHTIGPVIQEKMKEADPIGGILSLKVLDPAMGSGHFLVEATDRLAHALVEALGGTDQQREEEDVRWARREVIERCIYGVDLNPLAVELAKLSLWLHTVAQGKPLSFLDHHLKVGNSLIGARIEDLAQLPPSKKGKVAPEEQIALFDDGAFTRDVSLAVSGVATIVKLDSNTVESIHRKEDIFRDLLETHLKRWRETADLWVSGCFGNEMTAGMYRDLVRQVQAGDGMLRGAQAQPYLGRAEMLSQENRFFHWELEFPEVFYDGYGRHLRSAAGFDAVVGNPPYLSVEELDESDKAFLSSRFPDIAQKRFDTYALFLYIALELARTRGGVTGFIIPTTLFDNASYSSLRRYLRDSTSVSNIWNHGGYVFPDASNDCCSMIIRVGKADTLTTVIDTSYGRDRYTKIAPEGLYLGPEARISTKVTPEVLALFAKIDSISDPFERHFAAATQGLVTGNNPAFVLSENELEAYADSKDVIRRLAFGHQIGRYEQWEPREFVLYLTGDDSLEDYPSAKRRLAPFRSQLERRREVQRGVIPWYALQWPRDPTLLGRPSALLFQIIRNLALDRRLVVAKNVHGAYPDHTVNLVLVQERPDRSDYVLGLLNSSLVNWVFRTRYTDINVKLSYLRQAPIRRIQFTTSAHERGRLVAEAKTLDQAGDQAALLSFTDARLAAHPSQADAIHDLLAYMAHQMTEMNTKKHEEAKGFWEWLAKYTRLPIEEWRLKTTVKAYWEHGWDELQRALRGNRKTIEKASGRNVEGREAQEAIQGEFEKSMAKLDPLLERIARTDRLIDLIVYRLYGLTEEEVAIVEESVIR